MLRTRELKVVLHIVTFASVVLLAYLHAKTVSALLGDLFTPALANATVSRTAVTPSRTTQHSSRAVAPILERNVFDSTAGPIDGRTASDQASFERDSGDSDPLSASSCENVQALIVAESKDFSWSLALLRGPGLAAPQLRRVGDEVGGQKVAFIGTNPRTERPTVWLEKAKSLCQASLFGPKLPVDSQRAATPAIASPRPRRGAPAVSEAVASRIQKVSEREFRIERAAVDQILRAPQELMSAARVIPEMQGDKVLGLKLLGIRSDSLLGVLGLVNSDRLEAINGYDMTSTEGALEAYLRLRTAETLRVQLSRQGAPLTIDYHIQ